MCKELTFIERIDRLCNSFVKIYQCKKSSDDVNMHDMEDASYNYLDLIFEKCVDVIIDTENNLKQEIK